MKTETPATDEWTNRHKGRKKDTKRWCKGKPGREHTPVADVRRGFGGLWTRIPCGSEGEKYRNPDGTYGWLDCNHRQVCSTCGKELRWQVKTCPDTGRTIR